jgi:hypothetical protein
MAEDPYADMPALTRINIYEPYHKNSTPALAVSSLPPVVQKAMSEEATTNPPPETSMTAEERERELNVFLKYAEFQSERK